MMYEQKGLDAPDAPLVIWGHGWGQDHHAFDALVGSLAGAARHIVVDFPGFGASPVPFSDPAQSWGSADYAHGAAAFIRAVAGGRRVIWVGHSFGCRVGTQLGALYPDLLRGMVFIAGAGLKRRRGFIGTCLLKSKVYAYKLGKGLKALPVVGDLIRKSGLAGGAGSADYQKAGPMRGVLVRVVNEDLSPEAQKIQCPVLLLYGDQDRETPLEMGRRYNQLIKESQLVSLSGEDHYTVLTGAGQHQVAQQIKQFIKACTAHG